MKFLVVDDTPTIIKIVTLVLKKHGYTDVISAKDGVDAISLFLNEKPDVVFMDINMPVMDGCLASKFMKREDSRATLIAITGGDDINDCVDNFYKVVKKPINVYELGEVIDAL
jgi:DNA-binding response OmpR family regulator